jgi:hypothetical protein
MEHYDDDARAGAAGDRSAHPSLKAAPDRASGDGARRATLAARSDGTAYPGDAEPSKNRQLRRGRRIDDGELTLRRIRGGFGAS